MWFLPEFLSPFGPDCTRCKTSNNRTFGDSVPAAILIGLFFAYVWARLKPWVSPQPDDSKDYIMQDLHRAKSFMSNLHDLMWSVKSPPQTNESISKEGEDILLSKTHLRGAGSVATKKSTSETITGTLTIGTHIDKEEVERLKHKLQVLGHGDYVYQVREPSVLLQARLPITSELLSQAFEVARQGVALDPQCTLQLGTWGVILESEGAMKLLPLRDGDAPILLESFQEEDEDLRVEGMFLQGVQLRAVTGEESSALKTKALLKEGSVWVDALIVWAPTNDVNKTSLLYATKIVEFQGLDVEVRSGFIPVSFKVKPRHEDHTGLYLAGALAVTVALMPSQFWLPIVGKIGKLFLPIMQLAAVILGWNSGHFLLLGEWPTTKGAHELKLDAHAVKKMDHDLHRYITPWDSVVRMEMSDLERGLVQRLDRRPSSANTGIYAQQADYRTEFWNRGVTEMNEAIEIEPENELPFRVRGCIKGLAGNYEEALKDLDQAIEMKPDDVLAIVDRGVFRFLNGDFRAALADLDEGIRLEPLQPSAIMRLRETILQILEDQADLARLREENPRLKEELEATREKAAADLEAAEAKAAAELADAQAQAQAELEAAIAKGAAELGAAQAQAAAELQAAMARGAAELEAATAKAASELEAATAKAASELEAAQAKAAAELEAAQATAAAELEAAQAKAAADLEELRARLEAEIADLRSRLEGEMAELRSRLEGELAAVRSRLADVRSTSEAEITNLKSQNVQLHENLTKAEEIISKLPTNQTLTIQYNNICCEKCVKDIRAALLKKIPGVEKVIEDYMANTITVVGIVSTTEVLRVCREKFPRKAINLLGEAPGVPLESITKDYDVDQHHYEPQATPEPAPADPAVQPSAEPAAPEPAPEPEPAVEPAAEPAAPEPVPDPEPAPEPVPEAEAAPVPEPEQAPEPEAAPDPAPEPVPEAAPEPDPVPEAAPEPQAEGASQPVAAPAAPEPQPEAATAASEPQPEPAPERDAELGGPLAPETEATPEPEIAPAPVCAPEPETNPEAAPESAPLPEIAESVPEPEAKPEAAPEPEVASAPPAPEPEEASAPPALQPEVTPEAEGEPTVQAEANPESKPKENGEVHHEEEAVVS